jgi:alkylresorcinol/alkylpyrone synthase
MAPAPARILSVATAVPPHVYRQDEIREFVVRLFKGREPGLIRRLAVFENAQVETRALCMPLESFGAERTFGEKNDLYLEHAFHLSCQAVVTALARAGVTAAQVDHVIFVTSTGLATPTLDARLANHLGFRRDVTRTPIWGLACSGAAAGIARAAEFARARPASFTLVVSVELCSLAFQPDDELKLGLVSAALFADGAAAAVVAGPDAKPGAGAGALEILDARSMLWPDSLDVMGWRFDQQGLHLVLSPEIPSTVATWLAPALADFVESHGLMLRDIDPLVPHPGGAKVLDAMAEVLGLPEFALAHARAVLRDHGNMSSPTCLFVLERALAEGAFRPGRVGLLTAMGSGFSAESVLLRLAGS